MSKNKSEFIIDIRDMKKNAKISIITTAAVFLAGFFSTSVIAYTLPTDAVESDSVTVDLGINEVITSIVTSGQPTSPALTPGQSFAGTNSGTDAWYTRVTGSTNNGSTYSVSIRYDAAKQAELVHTTDAKYKINAASSTGVSTLSAGTWGYKVCGTSTWYGVTAVDRVISNSVAHGSYLDVCYGVYPAADQVSGTYTTTVVYTVTVP